MKHLYRCLAKKNLLDYVAVKMQWNHNPKEHTNWMTNSRKKMKNWESRPNKELLELLKQENKGMSFRLELLDSQVKHSRSSSIISSIGLSQSSASCHPSKFGSSWLGSIYYGSALYLWFRRCLAKLIFKRI